MTLPTSYSWTLVSDTGAAVGATGSGFGNRPSGRGKVGLAIPFSADGRGRLARVSGSEQLRKIILMNLQDLESRNPWQADLGLGSDMIFAIASAALQNDIRRRVANLFRRLQLKDRARLKDAPKFTEDPGTQELTMDLEYINLEEDKPDTVSQKWAMVPVGTSTAESLINALVGR